MWPLALLAIAVVAAPRRHLHAVVCGVLTVLVLASLAWSVHLTAADPMPAYYR